MRNGKSGVTSPASTLRGKLVSNWPRPAVVLESTRTTVSRSRPSLAANISASPVSTMPTIDM